MKIEGIIYKQKDNYVAVKCASDNVPKVGSKITIVFGNRRTIAQNKLYWVWLTWCVNNGLKDQGCLCAEELHETLKDYFLAEKALEKGVLKKLRAGTTTDLDVKEFNQYQDACDNLINSEYNVCTALFWEQYAEDYN